MSTSHNDVRLQIAGTKLKTVYPQIADLTHFIFDIKQKQWDLIHEKMQLPKKDVTYQEVKPILHTLLMNALALKIQEIKTIQSSKLNKKIKQELLGGRTLAEFQKIYKDLEKSRKMYYEHLSKERRRYMEPPQKDADKVYSAIQKDFIMKAQFDRIMNEFRNPYHLKILLDFQKFDTYRGDFFVDNFSTLNREIETKQLQERPQGTMPPNPPDGFDLLQKKLIAAMNYMKKTLDIKNLTPDKFENILRAAAKSKKLDYFEKHVSTGHGRNIAKDKVFQDQFELVKICLDPNFSTAFKGALKSSFPVKLKPKERIDMYLKGLAHDLNYRLTNKEKDFVLNHFYELINMGAENRNANLKAHLTTKGAFASIKMYMDVLCEHPILLKDFLAEHDNKTLKEQFGLEHEKHAKPASLLQSQYDVHTHKKTPAKEGPTIEHPHHAINPAKKH